VATGRLGEQASLIAVGGYGRGQLFPSSDIDVLVLLPAVTPAELPERVAALIGRMWDIGLEVGHSVRTAKNACRKRPVTSPLKPICWKTG
jgi:[protein-PII] uridylyltransferase